MCVEGVQALDESVVNSESPGKNLPLLKLKSSDGNRNRLVNKPVWPINSFKPIICPVY